MTFTYDIKAGIIDIWQDQPQKQDRFLIDTNVLFWWFYPGELPDAKTQGKHSKYSKYSTYLKRLRTAKARLYYTAASLLEVAHVVEDTVYKSYNITQEQSGLSTIPFKEFRHTHHDERQEILETTEAMWGAIPAVASCLDITMTNMSITNLLSAQMQAQRLDSYDYLYLATMQANNISAIITDDSDFATVTGIDMFTANEHIIRQARSQARLIQR